MDGRPSRREFLPQQEGSSLLNLEHNCEKNWLNFVVLVEKKLRSGNCSIHIGKLLLEQQSWGAAATALNNGIEKGGLDDAMEASELLRRCCDMLGAKATVEGS